MIKNFKFFIIFLIILNEFKIIKIYKFNKLLKNRAQIVQKNEY